MKGLQQYNTFLIIIIYLHFFRIYLMASSTKEKQERKRGGYIDFFCGWAAGCIETVLLYPQNKLIFRQQLHGVVVKEAVKQVNIQFFGYIFIVEIR